MLVEILKRNSLFLLVLTLLLVLGLAGSGTSAGQQLPTVPLAAPPYRMAGPQGTVRLMPAVAVADRLIVKLRPQVGPAQIGPLAAASDAQVEKLLPLSGMIVVRLPKGSDLQAAAQKFMARPEVEFAVPDTLVYPTLVPNDPQYGQQWHLPKIDAPQAWEVSQGTSTVTIAVVDSGCDMDHPDLAGKIWTNPGEIPGDGLDNDGNGYADDIHGWDFRNDDNDPTPQPTGWGDENVSHGTLVAGTAAAVSNEGWGAAGIDWQANIMVLQVFPASGGGRVSDVVEAINYATANGADIINLSLGGSFNSAFTPPIVTAYEAGKIVVSAAGNGAHQFTGVSSTWESPACNDGPLGQELTRNYVLSITGTDRYDQKSSQANWDGSGGNLVDVAAPGEGIYGPAFYDPAYPQFDEYWYTNTGTSFSCPIGSGIAGLLIAQNPSLRGDPATVYQIIRDTTDDIDEQNPGYAGMLGTGRVNAALALGLPVAPDPVTNFQAQDTAGDEGGSITLTWIKSVDDGGGSNSVTGYIVRRRTGESGEFSNIETLSPGTEQYDDGAVTDGTDYYYVIRTVATDLHTDSSIAGPVQSRDDSAPAQITTLTACDRPDDAGGVIELEWSYTAPADFDFYSIYRFNRNFNTVEGRTPLITFANPALADWTDTGVTDGADYYYAITATDDDGNENKIVQTAGPVQSYPNTDIPFDDGLQLLSAPAIPADKHPATLFGLSAGELVDRYARYDRVAEDYEIYTGDPLPEILELGLGRGFWVDLPYPVTVTPEGSSAPAGDFDVELQPGWQMLGNPFFGPTDFGAASVYRGSTYDLLSAHALGIIDAIAWTYDTEDQGYKMIAADGMGQRQIAPWQGFWLRAHQSCTFTIKRPADPMATAAQAASSSVEQDGWSLRLVAAGPESRDTDNFCGLRPSAVVTEIDNPPRAGQGVDLYLSEAGSQRRLAASFATQSATEHRWQVVVIWSQPSGEVSISWPNLVQLPSDYEAILTDIDGGATVNLRLQPRYTFSAREPGSRHFELSVQKVSEQPVVLSSVAAVPCSRGGELVFTLSQSAQCDIRVMNIAGRTIRVVETGQIHPPGQNVVPWDGRGDAGSTVPSGRYLITIEAAASNGTVARVLRSLNLMR